MAFPKPDLMLTIPSLHDGTTLDCRLYFPTSLTSVDSSARPWRCHAAVVAHPYAPMGGSCEDVVVETLAADMLREGFLVRTFNFRGAGHSAGRTSWTAKPERDDYASFVGFMVHFVHNLDLGDAINGDNDTAVDDGMAKNPFISDDIGSTGRTGLQPAASTYALPPVLLMCGYSYGAMITMQLGTLESLLEPLVSPAPDSDAAEIRRRAEDLAQQQSLALHSMRSAALATRQRRRSTSKPAPGIPSSPSRLSGVRVGGESVGTRKSHDGAGRRSMAMGEAEEKLRKGMRDFFSPHTPSRHARGERHWFHHRRSASAGAQPNSARCTWSSPRSSEAKNVVAMDATLRGGFMTPRPAYLLVSPLQGLATHLATLSLVPSMLHGRRRHASQETLAAYEAKLVQNPTLAIFGDNDVFVPVSKLRTWAARLSSAKASRFRALEVASAGHFWATNDAAMRQMRESAREFAAALMAADERRTASRSQCLALATGEAK